MNGRELHDDDDLLALLGDALDVTDPVPARALGAATAAFDLANVDGELAELVADEAGAATAGVRHEGIGERALSFAWSDLALDVELPPGAGRLLGQLDPPGPSEVEVELLGARNAGYTGRTVLEVDELGRFDGPVGRGPVRLHVLTAERRLTTPWITR